MTTTSRHHDRQYKLQTFFIQQVNDAFRRSIQAQCQHTDHIHRINHMTYDHKDWNKLTQRSKAVIDGYRRSRWDAIYRDHLTWGFFWDEHPGKAFPAFGPDRIDKREDWAGWADNMDRIDGQHFWKNDDGTIGPEYW